MIRSDRIRWVGLALLGLAIAVAVAVAASSLVSRQIGLASEPIEAGDTLAPAAIAKPERPRSKAHPQAAGKPGTTRPRPSAPTEPVPPAAPAQAPEEPPVQVPPEVEAQSPGGGDEHPGGDHAGHAADD